ncbi:MAG: methylase involved in ubiquinone/menaquinone biosynthesis [Haloquadratum sp. J07HQX50]|nr:MAG: methylase involved in ubiquinone/menaquinone biosynthesis [Haloquadratum sp. J07HQX50]
MTALLSERERSKFDTSSDDQFYDQPKLVTHADNGFLRRLQALYDEVLSSNDRVFDMMSSWVSHLPSREFQTVIGHGLNETELERNERLDEYFTQNLNRTQQLPLSDQTVDAVCCALSVQYLQYPSEVFAEIARILDAGGVLIVSFTNRMFPHKAIRAWREATMEGRINLVREYCEAHGFTVSQCIHERPAGDPFAAVVARPT